VATPHEIEQALHQLRDRFPEAVLDEETAQRYADGLAEVPGDMLLRAATGWDQSFFPTVTDLRRAAKAKQIGRVLATLAAAYPRFELPVETLRVYTRLLSDIPGDVLEAAALQHASNNAFFPTVAELRAAAFSLAEQAVQQPSGFEAWEEVTRAISRYGYLREPGVDFQWSHDLIGRTVAALGGWKFLCESENPQADRARFLQGYDVFVQRQRDSQRMLPMVRGQLERLSAARQPTALPKTEDGRLIVAPVGLGHAFAALANKMRMRDE
jgi:hypothetical protein